MLLSTSSSEPSGLQQAHAPFRRAIRMLLAGTFLLCVCVEIAATFGLERISRIHQRIMSDERQARSLSRAVPGKPKTLLLVGNSLLLAGLDPDLLRSGLAGQYDPTRYAIESTTYYDWLFGLRRLFRGGMRPDDIIVCLNPLQLATSVIRGDFSAHFLFGAADIWPMSRATGSDLTATTGFYVAHYSTFYAARSELRTVLAGKLSPSIPLLWTTLVPPRGAVSPEPALIPIMSSRLTDLDQLCHVYGVRFRFLVPPTGLAGDKALGTAGKMAHVRVLIPVSSETLTPSDYESDGFHLNDSGRKLFTSGLVNNLREER
jgi:hypothetical protein